MMDQEQWKDEVLQSLDGLARAQAPEQLFAQIRRRTSAGIRLVPRPYIAAVAAGFALLIYANLRVLNQAQSAAPNSSAYYQLEGADFGLYSPSENPNRR